MKMQRKLTRFEQDIKNHQKRTIESLMAMSKILYNARNILANNKNGTFVYGMKI